MKGFKLFFAAALMTLSTSLANATTILKTGTLYTCVSRVEIPANKVYALKNELYNAFLNPSTSSDYGRESIQSLNPTVIDWKPNLVSASKSIFIKLESIDTIEYNPTNGINERLDKIIKKMGRNASRNNVSCAVQYL